MKIAPRDTPHWQFQPGLVGRIRRAGCAKDELPYPERPEWLWNAVGEAVDFVFEKGIHGLACAIEGHHPYDTRVGSKDHYCCFCFRMLNPRRLDEGERR